MYKSLPPSFLSHSQPQLSQITSVAVTISWITVDKVLNISVFSFTFSGIKGKNASCPFFNAWRASVPLVSDWVIIGANSTFSYLPIPLVFDAKSTKSSSLPSLAPITHIISSSWWFSIYSYIALIGDLAGSTFTFKGKYFL
jgi:hypothetical protein